MTNPNQDQFWIQMSDLSVMIDSCSLAIYRDFSNGILQILAVLISRTQTKIKAPMNLRDIKKKKID